MRRVLIMMSTYNGHQYLREQLDSIYGQEGVDINLLVRDDGSVDDTVEILKEYEKTKGKISIIKAINKGAAGSFYDLIRIASSDYHDYDYYGFSDQDDVWFKNKVKTGVDYLEKSNLKYRLFYSNAIITDENLNPVQGYKLTFKNSFGSNFVGNHILGCSMLFNKNLLYEVNKINTIPFHIPNGKLPLHDAWVSLVAYSLDGDVIGFDGGLFNYRQHGNNVIGVNNSFFDLQRKRISRYLKPTSHEKANKCIVALQLFNDMLPKEKRVLFSDVLRYRNNFLAKCRILFNHNIYSDGIVENIGAVLLFLLNKF